MSPFPLQLSLAVLAAACCAATNGKSDDDYWAKIERLARKGTPKANAEGMQYLMSLTKDQTLTGLRQYSKIAEAKYSVDEWPQTIPDVLLIMAFYAEPMQFSDEEFATLPDKTKRKVEAGLLRGPLSDDAFDKMVAGIANDREGQYFRYALTAYAVLKEGLGPQLSKTQQERLFDACLSVAKDHQSPEVVRRECCDAAKEVFRRGWLRIIYADDVVKEFARTGPPDRWQRLDGLLYSGEIKLTAEKIDQLAPWRQRAEDFQRQMVMLQDDEQEPKSLREQAQKCVAWLEHLPLTSAGRGK